MANRFPLIIDTDDGNKLKELPIGDNLNLAGSGIVNAGSIAATGLTVAGVAFNPFSGSYTDLTNKPAVVAQTTDELPEGTTNQYMTSERVQDIVAAMLVEGTGIDLNYDDAAGTLTVVNTGGGGGSAGEIEDLSDVILTTPSSNQVLKFDGVQQAFVNEYVNYNEIVGTPSLASIATTGSYVNLTDKPSIPNDIDDLADVDTSSTAPTTGQVLKWNGSNWAPANDITQGGGGLDADTLDGQDSSYYLNYNNLSNTPNIFDGTFNALTGTPTTLAGYGITDAISRLGNVNITGSVTVADDAGLVVGEDGDFTLTTTASEVQMVMSTVGHDLAIKTKPTATPVTAMLFDTSAGRVGVWNTTPLYNLDVTGTFKADTIYGNGSNLTNISLDQVITGGSATNQPFSTGTLTSAVANTSDLGSTTNKWNNVYANNFHGDGSNITGISSTTVQVGAENVDAIRYLTFVDGDGLQSVKRDTSLVYNPSANTINGNINGDVVATNVTTQNLNPGGGIAVIPTYSDFMMLRRDGGTVATGIEFYPTDTNYVKLMGPTTNPASSVTFRLPGADGANGEVIRTDGAGNLSFGSASSIGNFTLSSSVIDTDDSSGITITPAVTMSSDLAVQNDLTVSGTITADNIVTTASGSPTLESNSTINLSATDRVVINKSPLTMASFTNTERDNLTATNGDTIYNTTTNKFQGYANGAWVDLH